MEKSMIGAILKKRIREMGLTQEEFAEEVGIGLSTLRKYISGKTAYSYEVLELFSEKLQCSYNYLLGKSTSPKDEFHSATELTRLSEEALEKISKYASVYDTEFEGRRYIKCLDMMIRTDGLFERICEYMITSRYIQKMTDTVLESFYSQLLNNPIVKELGIEDDSKLNLESMMLVYITSELKRMKTQMTQDFIDDLKHLDTEEDYARLKMKLTEYMKTVIDKIGSYLVSKRNNQID